MLFEKAIRIIGFRKILYWYNDDKKQKNGYNLQDKEYFIKIINKTELYGYLIYIIGVKH